MPLVLDCSLTLAWAFGDEKTPHADALWLQAARDGVVVPSLWFVEVANGLWAGERRKRIATSEVSMFLGTLQDGDIEIDDDGLRACFKQVLPIARAHKLTAYDAVYLELAERRGLPLATLDTALATAARSVGLEVLGHA